MSQSLGSLFWMGSNSLLPQSCGGLKSKSAGLRIATNSDTSRGYMCGRAQARTRGKGPSSQLACAVVTGLEAGLRDELITAAVGRALAAVERDLVATEPLPTADSPERIARHLALVARRLLRELTEREVSSDDQAAVVNRAIQLLASGDAAEEDLL